MKIISIIKVYLLYYILQFFLAMSCILITRFLDIDLPIDISDIVLLVTYAILFGYCHYKYNFKIVSMVKKIDLKHISYIIFFVSLFIISTYITFCGQAIEQKEVVEKFDLTKPHLIDIFKLLTLLIGLPVLEETFFRGIIYKGLRSKYNATVAIIISSCLFAFSHTFSNINWFISLIITSITYCLLLEVYDNIFFCYMGHIINNCLALFVSIIGVNYPNNTLIVISNHILKFNNSLVILSFIIFINVFLHLLFHLRTNKLLNNTAPLP